MLKTSALADEEKKQRKRESEGRRRASKQAKVRSKRIRRVAIFGLLIALVAGGSFFIISIILSGPGIGPLNSAHDHADFIVYINGEPIDFSQDNFQLRSNYIHLEGNDGDVTHIHATNAKLGFFLQTVGMRLTSTSITSTAGQLYENGAGRELKVYANGDRIDDPANYVLQGLDKILVAYGSENDEEIKNLLETIPDKAREHQGPG